MLQKSDIREVRVLFEQSNQVSSGWDMYDSAIEYFGKSYFEGLSDSISNREQHHEILSPYTVEEAQACADMYERMFSRVLIARQVLEQQYPELVELMIEHQYNGGTHYVEVLAGLLERHPSYRLAYNTESDSKEADTCRSVIQCLRGWLRSERIDEQG